MKRLLGSVSDALADQAGKSVFAVGGHIGLDTPGTLESWSPNKAIIIRWDSGPANRCLKASLPLNADDRLSQEAFSKLLDDSEPATYGVGSEEVLDESYRKAGNMNAARFSTNFNPYEHWFIDAISQALVHGGHRGIRAELYNLNVSRRLMSQLSMN